MRPGGLPTQQQPGTPSRARRRPDLTLPMPQREVATSLAVPLPLPPVPASAGGPTPPGVPASGAAQQQQPPPLAELERVRRVGSGAGGTVMVRHRGTGRPYALKVLYGKRGRGRSPRAAARGRARPSAAGRGRGSRACAGGRAPRTPGRGCGHRRARLELAGRGSRARRRGLCSAGREGELAAQAAQDAPAAPRRLALLCWPRARWPPPCARSRR